MIIGMDFGTTNSGIAGYRGDQLQLIPIDAGNQNATVARTALYITNDRQVYIGRGAIDTYYAQNLNRPVSIERARVGEITLSFAELPSFVRDVYIHKDVLSPGRLFLSFKTALSSLNYLGTVVGSHFYFLEDIVALYLYIAKQRAEQFLDTELKQIVLGRPVRFSFDPQADQLARERLLKAAFRAGYEAVYLQDEPVAAAYHYDSTIREEQKVLIFDFGGGTLDISVVRVGNGRHRDVLANGGVPVAGDVFDQKLARNRLPRHFGEGSYWRNGSKRLPVPNSFYEAFSNWQDMLNLHQPGTLETLQRIERSAERPLQIRALRQLISSSYGLKMYDQVEAVKRELSSTLRSVIRLEGSHFQVSEPVTRADFEHVIRQEINLVEGYLDELLRDAGLTNASIDRVIRTGGSSQIPAFVELLERRFGREKVGSIDLYASVTAGLGLIAHEIETGRSAISPHYRSDYPLEDRLDHRTQSGIPAVDFAVMKKFIALVETQPRHDRAVGIVGLTEDHDVMAIMQPPESFEQAAPLESIGVTRSDFQTVFSAAPADRILISTSEYRFFLKTLGQLAQLNAVGLDLAKSEGFQQDVFGNEYVTGLTSYEAGARTGNLGLLVTTSGYFRSLKGEPLRERLEQVVAYQPERLKGAPFAITFVDEADALLAFTSSGRAVAIAAKGFVQQREGRLISVPKTERIVGVWAICGPQTFLLATENGQMMALNSAEVPLTGLNTSGTKVFRPRKLKSVLPWTSRQTVLLMTSRKAVPLRLEAKDLKEAMETPIRPIKLAKGETFTALLALPPSEPPSSAN